jgi:hypothetical protein
MALLPAIAAAMNDASLSPVEHPPDHIRRWAAGLRAGQGPPEKAVTQDIASFVNRRALAPRVEAMDLLPA